MTTLGIYPLFLPTPKPNILTDNIPRNAVSHSLELFVSLEQESNKNVRELANANSRTFVL